MVHHESEEQATLSNLAQVGLALRGAHGAGADGGADGGAGGHDLTAIQGMIEAIEVNVAKLRADVGPQYRARLGTVGQRLLNLEEKLISLRQDLTAHVEAAHAAGTGAGGQGPMDARYVSQEEFNKAGYLTGVVIRQVIDGVNEDLQAVKAKLDAHLAAAPAQGEGAQDAGAQDQGAQGGGEDLAAKVAEIEEQLAALGAASMATMFFTKDQAVILAARVEALEKATEGDQPAAAQAFTADQVATKAAALVTGPDLSGYARKDALDGKADAVKTEEALAALQADAAKTEDTLASKADAAKMEVALASKADGDATTKALADLSTQVQAAGMGLGVDDESVKAAAQIEGLKERVAAIDAALMKDADGDGKIDIVESINGKADKSAMEEACALKADKKETEDALALKADKKETEDALADKADKSALALKADKSAIAGKADVETLTKTVEAVDDIVTKLGKSDAASKTFKEDPEKGTHFRLVPHPGSRKIDPTPDEPGQSQLVAIERRGNDSSAAMDFSLDDCVSIEGVITKYVPNQPGGLNIAASSHVKTKYNYDLDEIVTLHSDSGAIIGTRLVLKNLYWTKAQGVAGGVVYNEIEPDLQIVQGGSVVRCPRDAVGMVSDVEEIKEKFGSTQTTKGYSILKLGYQAAEAGKKACRLITLSEDLPFDELQEGDKFQIMDVEQDVRTAVAAQEPTQVLVDAGASFLKSGALLDAAALKAYTDLEAQKEEANGDDEALAADWWKTDADAQALIVAAITPIRWTHGDSADVRAGPTATELAGADQYTVFSRPSLREICVGKSGPAAFRNNDVSNDPDNDGFAGEISGADVGAYAKVYVSQIATGVNVCCDRVEQTFGHKQNKLFSGDDIPSVPITHISPDDKGQMSFGRCIDGPTARPSDRLTVGTEFKINWDGTKYKLAGAGEAADNTIYKVTEIVKYDQITFKDQAGNAVDFGHADNKVDGEAKPLAEGAAFVIQRAASGFEESFPLIAKVFEELHLFLTDGGNAEDDPADGAAPAAGKEKLGNTAEYKRSMADGLIAALAALGVAKASTDASAAADRVPPYVNFGSGEGTGDTDRADAADAAPKVVIA